MGAVGRYYRRGYPPSSALKPCGYWGKVAFPWEGRIVLEAVTPWPMRLTLHKREYVVVSVGGSLIVPDQIDTEFLTKFRELILRKVKEGMNFYIVTGGGKLARRYQDAAKAAHAELTNEDADWIGIHSTRLNAHLFRTIFAKNARDRIVKDPTKSLNARNPIIIGSGWKPGWSTDYCSVLAAKKIGAKKMVNLSNIDYVYDSDPRKNPAAKKFEKMTWSEMRAILPKEWDPGLSAPFDPIAAKEAEADGLEVAIMNGMRLDEFEKYLDGKEFIGTTVS